MYKRQDESILKLNILLNTMLNGKTIQEINLQMISSMKEQAGIHSNIVSDVVDAVAEAIHSDEGMEIYTGGATNIFRYPELSENGKASELIQTLEAVSYTHLVNEGFRYAGSEYVILLNNDTEIKPDFALRLLASIKKDRKRFSCQACMIPVSYTHLYDYGSADCDLRSRGGNRTALCGTDHSGTVSGYGLCLHASSEPGEGSRTAYQQYAI